MDKPMGAVVAEVVGRLHIGLLALEVIGGVGLRIGRELVLGPPGRTSFPSRAVALCERGPRRGAWQ